jgi:hypothetical protein
MIDRQIDSPMPIPFGLVVKKASNSRFALVRVLYGDNHVPLFVHTGLDQ